MLAASPRQHAGEPAVVGSLLVGANEMIGEMVRTRIPHMRNVEWGPFVALGILRRGHVVGGVVFNNFRGFDVHFSAALDRRDAALPGTVRQICDYPFKQLGVRRVTAITGRKNEPARKFLAGFGFRLIGVAKHGLDGDEDAFMFELLKEHCTYLKD